MSEFEFRRGLDVETRLGSEKFDLSSYVRDVVGKYDSSAEIKQHKQKVQRVAEKTSKELKQNVYKNYELFIDTSKEISSLEAEMYQLSHLLHEHKKLTDTLQDLSLMEDRTGQQLGVEGGAGGGVAGGGGGGEQKEKSIAALLETVEGGSIVTEVPGRYLVHIGHLTELNQESFDEVGTITAFLLNDSLMVASHIKRRRGPVRYRYQAIYELDSMAIVNVKDSDTLHYAFKILMFPDSHLYQAQSFEEKQRWMQMLESAKEKHQAAIDAAKKEAMRRTRQQSLDKSFTQSLSRSFTMDSEAAQTKLKQAELLQAAEWLKDIPENLDVYIAQREFDEAVDLIEETKMCLKDISDQHAFRDIRARLGHRINKLSAILMKELEASPSGSLRGGPRAARRAVRLLIRLGFSPKACNLFLENYRQIIQRDMDDVKMEGTFSLYISNFAATFFMGLRNAAIEFERAFEDNDGSYSAFIVWCNKQLQSFAKQSSAIIFPQDGGDKLPLSAVADCITAAVKECDKLNESGMDFSFALMQLYHPHLSQALFEERARIREQCATTGTAESWAPLDLRQEQAQLAAIQIEMEKLGVRDFRNLIHDGGFVDLSDTTIHFCKLVFGFVNEVMRFYTPEILGEFVDCFCDIFHNMILLYLDALQRDENMPMSECITNDANFVIHTLLLTVGTKIQQETGAEVQEVAELHTKLVDTFEKKSRESSVEPSSDTTADHGYHQARKLSEAAASGLEQEEEEVDEERERAPEAEQSSDEDDFV